MNYFYSLFLIVYHLYSRSISWCLVCMLMMNFILQFHWIACEICFGDDSFPSSNAVAEIAIAAYQVLMRFPNGERKERRFHCSATIESLYNYADSLDCLSAEKYSLVSNFPRVSYGPEKHSMSLKEAGLHPQASLFVEIESWLSNIINGCRNADVTVWDTTLGFFLLLFLLFT